MAVDSRSTVIRAGLGAVVVALAALAYTVGATLSPRGAPALAAAGATGSSAEQGITVDGVGRVSGVPDVLTVAFAVTAHRDSVSAALDAANVDLDRMRQVLLARGVAVRDLQTTDLSLQPMYGNSQLVTGYEADESLSARLHDLHTAGRTISDTVAAGGDAARLGGVSLDLTSDAALIQQARAAAFADAQAKATQYARLAGRTLGAVTSVSEQTLAPSPSYGYGSSGLSAQVAAAPVPVDAGTQVVNVTVTVVWSLR